jgi:hypothetical protein
LHHVLRGRFDELIWTPDRFAASSSDCGVRESWFCKGAAWKTRWPYSRKIKEMIMPGIMSEGVG